MYALVTVTALSLTKSQGLANYFLFFVQSRSPLRSFMENKKLRHDSRESIAN